MRYALCADTQLKRLNRRFMCDIQTFLIQRMFSNKTLTSTSIMHTLSTFFMNETEMYALTLSNSQLSLCLSLAMSHFRALAGVLRGGRAGGSQWLRGCGGGTGRRWVEPWRGCTSGAAPVLSAVAGSSSYVEEMYFAWLEDHKNVHEVTVYNMCHFFPH